MSDKTVKGFVTFIMEQEPSKKINHDNWYSCAIGDYLGVDINSLDWHTLSWRPPLVSELKDEFGTLYQAIADDRADVYYPTYGGLQKVIEESDYELSIHQILK